MGTAGLGSTRCRTAVLATYRDTKTSLRNLTKIENYQRRGYERDFRNYSWPQNYHNSFWSNYYTNYWQPSSSYYNSFTLPSSYLLPSCHCEEEASSLIENTDLFNYRSASKTSKNIKGLSHRYYSKMVAKRYPFVSGPVAMFV